MIRRLTIRNYKSLRNVGLEDVPNFAVVVGANASGKSNFADALDFLSLVFRGGLAYAVRTKGGYENICFRRKRRSKAAIEFSITAVIDPRAIGIRRRRSTRTLWYHYDFAFRATRETIAADYRVTNETLSIGLQEEIAPIVSVTRGPPLKIDATQQGVKILDLPSMDFVERYLADARVPEDELFFSSAYGGIFIHELSQLLEGCRVYQISPHMARETGVPERSPELGRHGENLPAAVDYIRRNHPQAFEELIAHLRHTVPAMEKLETRYVETKQLGLFFGERGVGRSWFSQDVSDGTLQTVSIFLPLLDPRVSIVVIEEPENSLHPWILRHFMETCGITSEKKQIIVTTHSLVAVDQVPLVSLYVISRDDGKTTIGQAARLFPEARQVISEQLLGLGEYWDSGALGGTPEPSISD